VISMRTLKTLMILIFISGLLPSAWGAEEGTEKQQEDAYKFGVFPYLSAVRMDKIYAPVSKALSVSLKHKIKFRTSSTFKKFLGKLKAEYYDFALIQPFWYPVAVDKKNYLPLLKMEEPFVSLIMVLDNSPIHTVDDLRGKIVATPPAFVPVVHMAKRALIKKGIVPGQDVTFKAYKTVDSCFQQVSIGKASACVAPPFVSAIYERSMSVKLRTILKSSSIPNLSLVIHPRVPENDRIHIKKTIMSWGGTEKGRLLLKGMQTRQFIPIIDKEYDVVREFLKEIKQ